MILPDVNVLVYAFRRDYPNSAEYEAWLTALMGGAEAYAVSDMVLCAVLRLVTNRRIFDDPDPLDKALAFTEQVRGRPNCVRVSPGSRHWDIFVDLCRKTEAKGNLVPDAYLAATVIEHGCELATTDRDFARFPGLRWRHPLD